MAANLLIKGYCDYTTSLFFRDIEVVCPQNVPQKGPTIVYSNHNNQFIDGMLLYSSIPRQVHFVAAAKSMRRRIIGDLLNLSQAIPLERAQDLAKKGPGKIIKVQNGVITGEATEFTKLKLKCSLKIQKQEIRVDEIISDTQVRTTQSGLIQFDHQEEYKIIPKLEYHELYHHVWAALNKNKCIGIFPEGGSHDRLELLPFKAGICIMALGAMEKYGCPVTLVPAGFNYYNPQNFRSKVILEFGQPYTITQQLVSLYRQDKKKAISTLLDHLEKLLKSVTTSAKNFDQLSTLFFCRELYTRKSTKRNLTPKEILQLNRRFAKGFDKLVRQPRFKQTHEELRKLNEYMKLNGLSLITKKSNNIYTDVLRFFLYFQKVLLRLLVALPGLILMYPTTTLITYKAEKERKRCLKDSDVKVKGNDVVGSYKILLSMIYFPITTVVHTGILYSCLRKFTDLPQSKCLKLCLILPVLMPFYALIFVQSYDSLGRSWTKLKYLFMRLFKRSVYSEFEQKKKQMSNKIVKMVDEFGEEVVEDFKMNRIIKAEDIRESSSQIV